MSLASIKRCWRCIRRAGGPGDRAGLASLEFAVITLPFFLLLLCGMDMGRYLIVEHSVRTAAADAIRAIAVNSSLTNDQCKQQVAPSVPFLDSGSLHMTCTSNKNTTTGVTTATVTASYPFSFLLPVFAAGDPAGGSLTETTQQSYL
jgi:Flp pilus assembly protein TadG